MLKKITSAILCLTLLLTLFPMTGVFAEDAVSATLAADDFEDKALTDGYFSNYPNAGLNQTSEVFASSSQALEGYRIVEAVGADGNPSKMIEMTSRPSESASNIQLLTNPLAGSEEKVASLSYDLYFKSLPSTNTGFSNYTSSSYFAFGRSGTGKWFACKSSHADGTWVDGKISVYDNGLSATGSRFTFEEQTWYKIIVERKDDYKKLYFTIMDKDGNVLRTQTSSPTASSQYTGALMAAELVSLDGTQDNPEPIELLIDNAVLKTYDPSQPVNTLKSKSSVENGATKVLRNQPFTFTFSQPVSGELVLKKGGEEVTGTQTVSKLTGSALVLNLPTGVMLDKKTEYTISFANVVSNSGAPHALEDITFTTENVHLWQDIEIGTAASNEGSTQITFTLTDEYNYPNFSGGVLAMHYRGGQMIGIDMVTLTNQPAGVPFSKSFTLGSTLQTGDTIKLMLADTDIEDGLSPLAEGTIEVE